MVGLKGKFTKVEQIFTQAAFAWLRCEMIKEDLSGRFSVSFDQVHAAERENDGLSGNQLEVLAAGSNTRRCCMLKKTCADVSNPTLGQCMEALDGDKTPVMGKLRTFAVCFDNPNGVYYAGQEVQGHVLIELTDGMKIRGIRLTFEGLAHVYWTESDRTDLEEGGGDPSREHSAVERYFDHELLLAGCGRDESGEDIILPSGRHTFQFSFPLPETAPSSYESAYGYVRYVAKGFIDRSWQFGEKTKRPFSVISVYDLNKDSTASIPGEAKVTKTLCCLCCASGPISVTFNIDRRGYVPGEVILLKAEIDNQSDRKISSTSVMLNMKSVYHTKDRSKSTKKGVARLKRGEVHEGENDYWNSEPMVIPPLPPSDLAGCKLIDVKYFLELKVDLEGAGLDLSVLLDVIIGTIPLQRVIAQHPPMPPPHGGMIIMPGQVVYPSTIYAPSTGAPQTWPPQAFPEGNAGIRNFPPPSYAESMFGKVDLTREHHDLGDSRFAPIYTYYNWGHTPSIPPPDDT